MSRQENRVKHIEGCTPGRCCTMLEDFGVVRNNVAILEHVDLHIHCGELTAVIGPNGAGKSTLLKAMIGEIKHTGTLAFHHSESGHSMYPVIGYVPQQMQYDVSSPFTVMDLFAACRSMMPVWLGIRPQVRQKTKQLLKQVQVEYVLDRKLGSLSGGELQRVMLALALDPIPDILLLDEPVSGIDMKGMELFYQMVSGLRKELDMSIILVSHDFQLISRFADRVVFLNRTILANGTPKEVFCNEKVIQTFGLIKPTDNSDDQGGGRR